MENMKKLSLIILLIASTAYFSFGQIDTTTYINKGDKAPAFTCTTTEGKVIDISKLEGKIIMINFFATWCPPCLQELPVLQKTIWEKYKNNPDFVLIIIGREHSEKEVRDFALAKKLTMPFAPDPKREIFRLYASQNIPRNIIIDRNGRVLFQSTGYTEEEFKKIEKLLAENLK